VTSDIFDANSGATHAQQTLTRLQFPYRGTYKYSMLNFLASPGQKMEFRSYWHDTSYVRENNVEVCGHWQVGGGDVLLPGQQWVSNNGLARLAHQTDGNVVLYAHTGQVLWTTNTYGRSTSRLIFQTDGNFVLYDTAGTPIWASYVWGGSTLAVQDDCNVVIYNSSNQPLWSTNTSCVR
jgi:hypothetical protein